MFTSLGIYFTCTLPPGEQNEVAFEDFVHYLQDTFPLFHSSEFVVRYPLGEDNHSRLYRIQGLNDTLQPYLLAAHMDVVPPGDEKKWSHDPFVTGIIQE